VVVYVGVLDRSPGSLDALAAKALREASIPGIAIAVVRSGGPTICRAYGLACRRPAIAATPSTPFFAASVSKPVVAAVIEALVERRMVTLDADVGSILPRPFRNPAFSSDPITLRMLLQHRASLLDEPSWTDRAYSVGDHDVSLSEWLTEYFQPRRARGLRGHGPERPGSFVRYSNVGYAVAAWVAEVAAAMPFDRLAHALVFEPLGMTRSSFRLRDVLGSRPAVPYTGPGGSRLRAVEHYGYPFYPAGTLRTSVEDLARFVRCMLDEGAFEGANLLAPETVTEMLPLEGTGLGWARFPALGRFVKGHEGADIGAGARVTVDLERRLGVVVLGNAEWTASESRSRPVETLEAAALAFAAGE
jgi:CubicO group peptidase (beta-lactamase class C family)